MRFPVVPSAPVKNTRAFLEQYLEEGGALCHGEAHTMTKRQSADRILRKLMESNPNAHAYVYVKGPTSVYKVFFKSGRTPFVIQKVGEDGYRMVFFDAFNNIRHKTHVFKNYVDFVDLIKTARPQPTIQRTVRVPNVT